MNSIPYLFIRSCSISPQRTLSLSPQLESAEEQSSFHFFTSHAVLELPGFFTSSFWEREVLQAAQRQPAIKYAVIALGAMHRRYITGKNVAGDGDDWELRFALQQSNRAIQEILAHTGRIAEGSKEKGRRKADKVTIMTSCVLFNCMACLQGHQMEALQHLRSGIRLLREIDEEDTREGNTVEGEQEVHPVSVKSLRSIFIGLDLQARSVMSRVHLQTWEPVPLRKSPALSDSSKELDGFCTLADVQLHLESTLNEFLAFVQTLNHFQKPEDQETVNRTFQGLKTQAEEGSKMLDEVLSQSPTHTNPQKHQTFIALRLLRGCVDLAIAAFEVKRFGMNKAPTPEFDQTALSKFASMMDMMSELVGFHESNSSLSKRPVFSFTFGVLATLWWVAQSAPSPTLRLKAIMMMMEHPRREGLWDGPVAGQVALEAVQLEMESVKEEFGELKEGEDVPSYLRVKNIDIEYIGTTGARVEFKNGRDTAMGKGGHIRHMTWESASRNLRPAPLWHAGGR
jgi:hypothetical protein